MGKEMSGRYPRLTPEDRKQIIGLAADGMRAKDIAREVVRSAGFVRRVIRQCGGVARRLDWNPSPARLSAAEREEIRCGLDQDETFRQIACRLDRAPSTISREVNANGGRDGYEGWRAHRRASDLARRPKIAKLAGCARLRAQVEAWLEDEFWSPAQISAELRSEFPDDPMMRVARNDLPIALCPRPRRAPQRTRSVSAYWPGGAPEPVADRDPREDPEHGQHL